MKKKTAKHDVVECPLCCGRGEVNKHLAVVRYRDPEFRETILNFQDEVLDAGTLNDPFETHQTVSKGKAPGDHVLAHRSWKE